MSIGLALPDGARSSLAAASRSPGCKKNVTPIFGQPLPRRNKAEDILWPAVDGGDNEGLCK